MSNFRTQATSINDQGVLVECLKKLGYSPSISEIPTKVRGHYNEERTAHVILRKEDMKQGGDIGFSKGQDGNFSIVTDTYVMKNFSLPEFQKTVTKAYAEAKVRKLAKNSHLTFVGRKALPNGKVQLVYSQV